MRGCYEIHRNANGHTEKAKELLAAGYIQHNLAYGTGAEAFVGSVAYLASAPAKTTVQNIRTFEDGDKVFLQTVYNFAGAGEQVAFDIFRFDADGKIAEHWDNLAAKAEPNPSGHTQIDGYDALEDLDKTQGDYGLFQSVDPSNRRTFDNESWVMQAMEAQGFVKNADGVF